MSEFLYYDCQGNNHKALRVEHIRALISYADKTFKSSCRVSTTNESSKSQHRHLLLMHYERLWDLDLQALQSHCLEARFMDKI